VLYERFKV